MKYFFLIPFILVFLIFDGGQCYAQLLNVESMRIRTDTTGWFGEVGLSGSYIESESTVLQADARGLIEYKGKKSLILLLGNYNLLTGDGKSLVDNYMLHLRYNYKITKWLRWEVFGQYQQNEILSIHQRILLGTGPRYKLADNKKVRLYLGTLVMWEFEQESNPEKTKHDDYRFSNYLSFNITPASNLEIVSTTYYQPQTNYFPDFRILKQNSLLVKAGKHFVFSVNYQLAYDSRPAIGILNRTSQLSSGLAYKF